MQVQWFSIFIGNFLPVQNFWIRKAKPGTFGKVVNIAFIIFLMLQRLAMDSAAIPGWSVKQEEVYDSQLLEMSRVAIK